MGRPIIALFLCQMKIKFSIIVLCKLIKEKKQQLQRYLHLAHTFMDTTSHNLWKWPLAILKVQIGGTKTNALY